MSKQDGQPENMPWKLKLLVFMALYMDFNEKQCQVTQYHRQLLEWIKSSKINQKYIQWMAIKLSESTLSWLASISDSNIISVLVETLWLA